MRAQSLLTAIINCLWGEQPRAQTVIYSGMCNGLLGFQMKLLQKHRWSDYIPRTLILLGSPNEVFLLPAFPFIKKPQTYIYIYAVKRSWGKEKEPYGSQVTP